MKVLRGSNVLLSRSQTSGELSPLTDGVQRPTARCHSSSVKQAEVQCVKIAQNRDSSITYYFSEKGSALVWQQLEAQLATSRAAVPSQSGVSLASDGASLAREEAGGSQSTAASELSSSAHAVETLPPVPGRSSRGQAIAATLQAADELRPRVSEASEAVEEPTGAGGDDHPISLPKSRATVRAKLERTWHEHSDDELPRPAGRASKRFRKHPRQTGSNYAHSTLASMNEADEETLDLLSKFSELCRAGQLEAALAALSRFVKAGRKDVLVRLRQKHFLKEAARQATPKAVKMAFRFVQLLPRTYASLQTYNMLITVCGQAKDKAAALQTADMLRSVGRKPDAKLYTNLISACAAAGDADAAFQVYSQMTEDGLTLDVHSATSLINACSREILATCSAQRRRQLVLLERADSVLHDFVLRNRGKLDQGIWNAFITAAGRAAQLQRAVRVLGEMQATGMKPSQATFGAVLDACVRGNDKLMALDTYRRAMEAGMVTSLHLHTGAIAACRADKDMTTALHIFTDMQRHGVEADERLYAVLISVIGAASLSTALDLHDSLLKSGVGPFQGIHSNLIDACLEHRELASAAELFRRAHQLDIQPSVHVTNALLNACAKTGDLAEVLSLLQLATKSGFKPDKYTYTAVLNACQYAGAGDAAVGVWRLMQQQQIPLDEASGFVLIRTCFNQLQNNQYAVWEDTSQDDLEARQMSAQLLDALAGRPPSPVSSPLEHKQPWGQQAISVYQSLLASGVKPRIHVLERLLACLRLRPSTQKPTVSNSVGAPIKIRSFLLPDGRKSTAPQHSVDGIYENRAFSILEGATSTGVVPCFKTGGDSTVDLRCMPPVVAEVYVLNILAGLSSQEGSRRRQTSAITLKTVPYQAWQQTAWPGAISGQNRDPQAGSSGGDDRISCSATGPAVAALLKRLNLRTVENPSAGDIILTPNALTRWRQLKESRKNWRRAASSVELAALSSIQKAGHLRSSIHDQQMRIRLGMGDSKDQAFAQPQPWPRARASA